jgi:hypothetical protein
MEETTRPAPPGRDDGAELLEDQGGADQVDGEDCCGRRLDRGQARGVHDVDHAAEPGRGLRQGADRVAGGDIDVARGHRVPAALQAGLGRIQDGLAMVGEQNGASGALPAGDGQADAPGSDDDDDFRHEDLPW